MERRGDRQHLIKVRYRRRKGRSPPIGDEVQRHEPPKHGNIKNN
jgi:hypothetical protein